MNPELLSLIESAQRTINRFALNGFTPALTIRKQLSWCWHRVSQNSMEPLPAPLCMAYLMEHEFRKFGAYPLLAEQLRRIESSMDDLIMDSYQYADLAA
jgi:hypothetical protein